MRVCKNRIAQATLAMDVGLLKQQTAPVNVPRISHQITGSPMARIVPVLVFFLFCGCAEGPLWQSGTYLPWVQERWQAEEEIADTYFERTRNLDQLVQSAAAGTAEQQKNVAIQLKEIIQREPIILVKLHAVELLAKLHSPEAVSALELASKDPDSRIRRAAVRSLRSQPSQLSLPQLAEVIGSDTNVDVRLEATKVLGDIGDPNAVNALNIALVDSNPAIQYRATESLEKLTGQNFGADVSAWQSYLENIQRTASASSQETLR